MNGQMEEQEVIDQLFGGIAVGRAFIVNGIVLAAYEIAMRSPSNNGSSSTNNLGDPSFIRNKRQLDNNQISV
ncbi:hypothetical protein K1719_002855 [Acacia pycnantha]|nr:hypothetical protein K1719_002855 [Acacia pycnantha]